MRPAVLRGDARHCCAAALMAAHDDLAATAQRLEDKARASGDKTHLGTAAGVRLAAFRLIELADGVERE